MGGIDSFGELVASIGGLALLGLALAEIGKSLLRWLDDTFGAAFDHTFGKGGE